MMRKIRLASYNVHSCIGSDYQYSPERVCRVLEEIDADIVALQELGSRKASPEDQFDYFRERLEMSGVFGAELIRGPYRYGNAVLARGRIPSAAAMDLTIAAFEPRSAIECVAEVGPPGAEWGRIRIIATHLGLLPYERRRQIRRLATLLPVDDPPVTVLLGDFNIFGFERRALRRIGSGLLPRIPTFPAYRPLVSLDRIWTVPHGPLSGLRAHRSELSRVASDHLPIVAEVELSEAGAGHARETEAA